MPHGGNEPLLADYIFSWLEQINPRTGPLNDVGQAKPPIRKTPIVSVREQFSCEPGLAQKFPKTVRMPGKVMAGCG